IELRFQRQPLRRTSILNAGRSLWGGMAKRIGERSMIAFKRSFQPIAQRIEPGVMHVLLERVHADVLADQLNALDAAVELDLTQPADVDAISTAPLKQLLDLHALHEPLPPDQRPGFNRQEFAIVTKEIGKIRFGLEY